MLYTGSCDDTLFTEKITLDNHLSVRHLLRMVLTPTACVQLVLELLTLLSGAFTLKSALQWAEA